jgi:hypothetical protein
MRDTIIIIFTNGDFMKNFKSFYIIPIHNKEIMIKNVLDGISNSHDYSTGAPIVICILDGCTDNSEKIIRNHQLETNIIYENDVHEIKSLNKGLMFIRNNLSPLPNDLIFMIQDDVILDEKNINDKFANLFEAFPQLGYVSMRMGMNVSSDGSQLLENNLIESEFGAWDQLGWNAHTSIKHNNIIFCEVVVRSPTCMMWKRFEEVGFFDENLAPAGFDCHDMSIRLNKLGYQNALYTMKYISDVTWGTMRQPEHKEKDHYIHAIYDRNRNYLAQKHRGYFNEKF